MSEQQIEINLAPQILETYRESNRLADEAKGYASEAVAKAVQCGQLLLQQKAALQHGTWLDWLATNLSEINERTARRYMALANRTHVTDLNDAASVRQAYLATGIIPPSPKKELTATDPDKPWVRFTRFLDGFRLWFNKRIDSEPLDQWPTESRRVLKNELRWFAELYARL
jgi:hypothetical protein